MIISHIHSGVSMLALFQATQLNLFERFLNQALAGINSTNITSGMQNVAYVVLLVGFLWEVYQSALHGGDVRSLGTNLIKYVVTTLIVMNYSTVFSTINQGFVNGGNWISSASGAASLFENWKTDLQTQFSQDGTQKLWELITGDIPALLDGLLIIVAYLLYPFVIAIFGFFYIFYGSILYIFGPVVVALMPLGATSRLAKSYVEHVFIWNAWPILYGGFGALLSAVQMGQIGQMLGENNFLGGFGNLEGSLLIGIASIIYSLAIAIIPFIAWKIVRGDVGGTAGAMIGAAATALTLGTAAVEGGIAGASAGGASSAGVGGKEPAGSATTQNSGSRTNASTGAGNQPAAPQRAPSQVTPTPTGNKPATANSTDQSSSPRDSLSNTESGGGGDSTTQGSDRGGRPKGLAEEHVAQIRRAFMPGGGKSQSSAGTSTSGSKRQSTPVPEKGAVASRSASGGGGSPNGSGSSGGGRTSSGRGDSTSRGNPSGGRSNAPSARREGLATWGAYHAARLATQGIMNAGHAMAGTGNQVASAIKSPVDMARKMGTQAGKTSGAVANTAARTAQTVAHAVSHPGGTVRRGAAAANSTMGAVTNAANRAANTARSTVSAVKSGFSSGYDETRSGTSHDSTEVSKD